MLLFDDGIRSLSVKYLQKRDGIYCYRRRYPADLVSYFGGIKERVRSLSTKSGPEAAKLASKMALTDNATWASIRLSESGSELTPFDLTRIANQRLDTMGITPGERRVDIRDGFRTEWSPLAAHLEDKHLAALLEDPEYLHSGALTKLPGLLEPIDKEMLRIDSGTPRTKHLSDALAYYLKDHKRGQLTRFAADAHRAIDHVIRAVGDLPLAEYRRHHAEAVRDALVAHGYKTQSVRRNLSSICAIFKRAIIGFDLQMARHPFADLQIKAEGDDTQSKEVFTLAELHQVSGAVQKADDTLRHIIAILMNTGARISEIVGRRFRTSSSTTKCHTYG
jgi:hypothetical protein